MADGIFHMPYARFIGYKSGNHLPEIIECQAVVVRQIYALFLQGRTPTYIAHYLTQQKILSPGGKDKWQISTVKSILTNEKYCGSSLLQKTFIADFLTKKKKINRGELPQFLLLKIATKESSQRQYSIGFKRNLNVENRSQTRNTAEPIVSLPELYVEIAAAIMAERFGIQTLSTAPPSGNAIIDMRKNKNVRRLIYMNIRLSKGFPGLYVNIFSHTQRSFLSANSLFFLHSGPRECRQKILALKIKKIIYRCSSAQF